MDYVLAATARPADAPGWKKPATGLTPYAEQLLARSGASQAGNSSLNPCGEWINTRAAAKLTGYSQRQIQSLCDAGFFVEGKEWKQRPATPGTTRPGRILIRQSALKKMEGES